MWLHAFTKICDRLICRLWKFQCPRKLYENFWQHLNITGRNVAIIVWRQHWNIQTFLRICIRIQSLATYCDIRFPGDILAVPLSAGDTRSLFVFLDQFTITCSSSECVCLLSCNQVLVQINNVFHRTMLTCCHFSSQNRSIIVMLMPQVQVCDIK